MIDIREVTPGIKDFYFSNGVHLGFAYREVDGYYYFRFQHDRFGIFAGSQLRMISDKLGELNAEWDKKVDKDLK